MASVETSEVRDSAGALGDTESAASVSPGWEVQRQRKAGGGRALRPALCHQPVVTELPMPSFGAEMLGTHRKDFLYSWENTSCIIKSPLYAGRSIQ